MLGNLIGVQALSGTEAVYAGETFAGKLSFTLDGVRYDLSRAGPGFNASRDRSHSLGL
jgi:hypothetical protein